MSTGPTPTVRIAQIIVLVLAMGALAFTAVALLVALPKFPGVPHQDPVLSILGMAVALILLGGSLLLAPRVGSSAVSLIAREKERVPELQEMLGPYVTMNILAAAPLEGAVFFNGVALIVDARWWSLATIGGLLGVMLLRLPTQSRFVEWSRKEREKLELRGTYQE